MLDRDPAAVAALRAELVRRRDAAAAGLAFEFAGQVQAELEALDWITAEQKVTLAQPSDFDVLRLGRRGAGSLRGPRRPPVRLEPARLRRPPPPAVTWRRHRRNPAWADFARRSAELAARLRSPHAELAALLAA